MKRIIALALVLVSVLSLIACTGSKEVVLDIDAVAKKLASLPYVEKLEPLDPAVVTTLYAFTSGAEKVVAYGASGATPEELIVAE